MLLQEIKAENQTSVDYKLSQGLSIAARSSINRLLRLINFSLQPKETEIIQQKLVQAGKKPSPINIKKHMIRFLLEPSNEIPQPELVIILRAGSKERLDLFN